MGQDESTGREELSKAVHETDCVLKTLSSIGHQTAAALRHARAAQESARAKNQPEIEAAANELAKQFGALLETISGARADLDAAHAAAQTIAPSEVVAALREQQAKFAEAAQEPELKEGQKAFKDVADALSSKLFGGNDEATDLRTYASFKAVDLHRLEVTLALKSPRGQAKAESDLLAVRKTLEKLLDSPDAKNTPEGSSLHAVMRRWIINIDASFFDRYYRNSNDPRMGKRYKQNAIEMRDHAIAALEVMDRLHAADTTPNGDLIAEQVRLEVERLFRRN